MRSWAQRAEELLMELREYIDDLNNPTISSKRLCQKIDHFLLTGEYNTETPN